MTTFTTPAPIDATLVTAGARVRVTASERQDTVVRVEPVDAAGKADRKVAENTEVEFASGRLSVKTNKAGDRNGSVAITVELPAGSRLHLSTAWTDVHADGPLGDCQLDVVSGRIHLDHVAGLRGRLAAGEVVVGHVAGVADIDGGTAGVRLGEVDGDVRYIGSTGQVWIGHAKADVDLNGSSGAFDIDRADGDVVAKAAGCPIRVGRMTSGHADLMNASGGIEVGIGDRSTAVVDADNTKGAVRNTLSAQDNPADFDHKVTVHARTRRDDIVIRRA